MPSQHQQVLVHDMKEISFTTCIEGIALFGTLLATSGKMNGFINCLTMCKFCTKMYSNEKQFKEAAWGAVQQQIAAPLPT